MNPIFSRPQDGGPFSAELKTPRTEMLPARRAGLFAVIQVDGREVLLRVARQVADGSFQTLRHEREGFHPGGGAVDARQVAVRLADVLSRFQRTAEMLGAAVRAVATQAFRSIPNHLHLLRRLPRVTRVALDLISERDAARFVCLGALAGAQPGQRSLVIEVGDEATSIVLANADEPLALWRLPIGTARYLASAAVGIPGADWDRVHARHWRRQIQQTLAQGHLDAIRGAARDAVLIRARPWPAPTSTFMSIGSPAQLIQGAGVALLDELAAYLEIRNLRAVDAGLPEGVLVELSRALTTERSEADQPSELAAPARPQR